MANRLTENENWNVLLVEAGNVETLIQNIPLIAANGQAFKKENNGKDSNIVRIIRFKFLMIQQMNDA